VHHNVTAHPTADWTLQQFREALPGDHGYQYVIHDRDRIHSHDLDQGVESMGVRVVRTPVRSPKANGYCERLVRTARGECLDFLIPPSETHLKRTLVDWSHTTITAVHIAISGREFERQPQRLRRFRQTATKYLTIAVC
jgi:hypothetical protein